MKLINARNRQQPAALAPCHLRILAKYGDAGQMAIRFMPNNLPAIYRHRELSVQAEAPVVGGMVKAYGEDNMTAIFALHVHKLMVYGDIAEEKIDKMQVREIARNMLLDEGFRQLNIAYALSFFQEVMNGHYKLYGYRAIDFMNAMVDYTKKALAKQRQLYTENENRQRREAEVKRAASAMTFADYCKSRGLDPAQTSNPLEMANGGQKSVVSG